MCHLQSIQNLVTIKSFMYVTIIFTLFYILIEEIKVLTIPIAHYDAMESVNLEDIEMFIPKSLKLKDWHNYKQIAEEQNRTGIGEKGKPAYLPKVDENLEKKLFNIYSFNALLSENIPLNRSLPDLRHPICENTLYIESLPTVSIVISFYNEHWKTLLRTVYSALHRSAEHLIKEVLLVNDASSNGFVKKVFEEYLDKHMPKVKVIHLEHRNGLIRARLAGAKKATGDVLVFMDAHTEANVNWLPPLLEPIALNYRTVVSPVLDVIAFDTFKYSAGDDKSRGAFDWSLTFMRLPMLPKDFRKLPEPFESPIMIGGVFAISRHFFWELGGFDPGLRGWGGEQYEISFKIWMCGGRILEVPCSRIGHIYRKPEALGLDPRNFRRIVDVWMDEYAKYVYLKRPFEDFNSIDPGDLTQQKELRKKLNCKPFKWFLTQVAFELTQHFPPIDPPLYGEGQIRPISNLNLCVDSNNGDWKDQFVLKGCDTHRNLIDKSESQQIFVLTWFNDVMLKSQDLCWDIENGVIGANLTMFACHHSSSNQLWKYDQKTRHFEFKGVKTSACLDYNPHNLNLFLNNCDRSSKTQRWKIDTIYEDQMAKWNISHSNRVTGPVEEWKE